MKGGVLWFAAIGVALISLAEQVKAVPINQITGIDPHSTSPLQKRSPNPEPKKKRKKGKTLQLASTSFDGIHMDELHVNGKKHKKHHKKPKKKLH
ncbi:hypothetical protein BY996DRAFT_3756229 [Phakopsora pachyrhizi]|uniref:Secreted protein n=1 Tax=Phakopsora pachyrhizi TaxID=170000 RepID=A0AAV0ASJ6_PHAPC|nr:hypothetical protein BY996DRAFT_3756229 [Phakopsora pachyrhizi]CAH7670559.1 hypothetical protein PPACK8108_LOCUS5287 [Phakopsora pachyrhizi]